MSGSEEEIIQRAQSGDKDALSKLVNEYSPMIYRFSYNVCRNDERAQNTTQETFLSMVKNIKQFNNKSKFSTWLYTIVSNHCFMLARKNKPGRFVSIDDDEHPVAENIYAESDATPDELLERTNVRELLQEAMDKLAPEYRIIFTLRDVEGLSTAEVAQITDLSVPAVKSRLHRARAFLREYLTPIFEEETNG
ncbi:MAG: RNA polymerase subunit sigma-70 [Ectothiorhodospiraceae bacterium]|nr:RNA polymerase subunit sigma-70 [Ectothiorhodospiraceae bacterium]